MRSSSRAFIPARDVLPGVGLQGLVMFGLYVLGIVGAFVAALVLRRTVTKGAVVGLPDGDAEISVAAAARRGASACGSARWIFLKRAGTIIALTTVVLWALLSFPKPPAGSR